MLWLLLILAQEPVGMTLDRDGEGLADEAWNAYTTGDFIEAAGLFAALAEGGAGDVARYYQGLCLYEAGDLRGAEAALTGVDAPDAWNLLGLVLVERGEPARGLPLLRQALDEGPPQVAGRASINLGYVELSRGHLGRAEALMREGLASGLEHKDSGLVEAANRGLQDVGAARGEGGGAGLNRVGDALRRGDLATANVALESLRASADTPRRRVEHGLASASVMRASGDPDSASLVLMDTLALARESGLAWHTAQALFKLGIAHSSAGRHDLALTFLVEAEATARDAGFLADAVEFSVEIGLLALRVDRVELAEERLAQADSELADMDHPAGVARAAELRGGVRARQGRLEESLVAYEQALTWHESRGHYSDAARVAVGLVRATAGVDPAAGEKWAERARVLFAQYGDPAGPAHVELARGNALVEVGELEKALEAYALAEELAGGGWVAEAARRNAGRALIALGASPDGAEVAVGEGAREAITHHAALTVALEDYERGIAHFNAADYAEAHRLFKAAEEAFSDLGEGAYGRQAGISRTWAAFNLTVSLAAEEAYPYWADIQGDAVRLDDIELAARAGAAAALDAQELGHDDTTALLHKAATNAEAAGLPELAATCWAALSAEPRDLVQREQDVRRAFALAPSQQDVLVAMYELAVDAYNAEEHLTARGLAQSALPHASTLAEAFEEVLAATEGY